MKPLWFKIKLAQDTNYELVKEILNKEGLNTICIKAKCPNRIECFKKRAMTFLILGDICTRNCRFCAVKYGNPCQIIDESEQARISRVVKKLGLRYVVLTSVTRDDLNDGGALIFLKTIKKIHADNHNVKIEVLVPDFSGSKTSIQTVISAGCDVFSHNVETTERLTPIVRDKRANYRLSLEVLNTARTIKSELTTKSGFMLGLGETEQEIKRTIKDLLDVGVSILTIGQYLQPTKDCLPVRQYVRPQKFQYYKDFALDLGFKKVVAGPLVRSSYKSNITI